MTTRQAEATRTKTKSWPRTNIISLNTFIFSDNHEQSLVLLWPGLAWKYQDIFQPWPWRFCDFTAVYKCRDLLAHYLFTFKQSIAAVVEQDATFGPVVNLSRQKRDRFIIGQTDRRTTTRNASRKGGQHNKPDSTRGNFCLVPTQLWSRWWQKADCQRGLSLCWQLSVLRMLTCGALSGRANLTSRSTAGCCHLANLTVWSDREPVFSEVWRE